jgi:WhiB family redox-sensing transcriptional regulator
VVFHEPLEPLDLLGYMPPAWSEQAACRNVADPDLVFFPVQGGSSKAARVVCGMCGVRAECLMHALREHEVWGIWGGTSNVERRVLLREMRAAEEIPGAHRQG